MNRVHRLDWDQPWSIRCNNPNAKGSATITAVDVTCRACQRPTAPTRSEQWQATALIADGGIMLFGVQARTRAEANRRAAAVLHLAARAVTVTRLPGPAERGTTHVQDHQG